MHTNEKLARELRKVGLPRMAELAEKGYYHDYLSPLDMPISQLVNDLHTAAERTDDMDRARAINELRRRAMDGDFDASPKEAEEWAASPEGKKALAELRRPA